MSVKKRDNKYFLLVLKHFYIVLIIAGTILSSLHILSLLNPYKKCFEVVTVIIISFQMRKRGTKKGR